MTSGDRLLPDIPLPARPYVPGGEVPRPQVAPDLPDPPPPHIMLHGDEPHLLYGADLFHHGFWWEAHECWEALWHGRDRHGGEGLLVQGLILLAAAHLQWSRERLHGRNLLARRALARLESAARCVAPGGVIAGIVPAALHKRFAAWLVRDDIPPEREAIRRTMPRVL